MRIIKNEKWSVENTDERIINLSKNGDGDAVVSDLFVNPLSDCDITVTGYVSDEDETGIELSCIDIGKLAKVDAITEAGNYNFSVSSYCKVKLEVSGTADILLKTIY